MAVMELWRRRDLEGAVKTEYVDGNFFTQDSVGNLVGVKCYKDGAEATLSGSVTGYCILPSGETVSVAGTRSGNQAYILIPQSALAYAGPLGVVLKLIDGNTITTLISIIVVVYRSKTDTVITPSSQIITDWSNQIAAALQDVEDASAAQDVKINDLKSALRASTTNGIITMTDGGFIACNTTTGININNVTSRSGYRYAAVPCSAGDRFTVSCTGASTGRAWAFIDSSGNLLQNAPANSVVADKLLIAPSNAAYLIINDSNTGAVSYYGQIISDKLDAVINSNHLIYAIWENGSLTSGGGENSLAYRIRTNYVEVSSGEELVSRFDKATDRLYAFGFSDTIANSFVRTDEIVKSERYVVPQGVNFIRFVFGPRDESTIGLDYANNVEITKAVSQLVNTDNIYAKGEKVSVTFTTGNYMTADGARSASGWSYTSNVNCSEGQILRIKNSYSPDYRPVLFFDEDDNCVGFYDTGVNRELVPDFCITAPKETAYAIINTASDDRTNLTIEIIDSSVALNDDIAVKSWQNISVRTGHKLMDMFAKIREAGPLFTIVDDDGRNYDQVSKFHNVVSACGIVGCNALATKFIENMSSADRETFIATLKGYESEGFQNVLHCYDHDNWQSNINDNMTDAQQFSAITSDLVHGIRDMESMGFVNWRHWIVPQGKTNLRKAETCARNLGFDAAYDVANNTFNHFANRDNLYKRYSIARMELYPEDEGHSGLTLQLIKDQADICAREGGWLIVCTHFYQSGWESGDPTFSRVTQMINYIMGLGFKNVTLSGGMSYWEDIYRMYDLF